MRPASNSHATYLARPSWRNRLASIAIALLLVGLLVLVLIRMGAMPFLSPGDGPALSTFNVGGPEPKAAPSQARSQPAKAAARKADQPRQQTTEPPLPPPPIVLPGVINLSQRDYAASDIAQIPQAEAGSGGSAGSGHTGSGAGSSTKSSGSGPNGETLYNAEWVREPTRAELITYLPQREQTGWGIIACRTVERNRVEDCREIGESPGSGIARGLRRASWQFLVRPPRVNGRPMVGAWVSIKFDLVVGVSR